MEKNFAKGGYKTNNRKKILEFLISNKNKTVSALDIRKHMESLELSVNSTTIYRYLDKLEADGNVIKYAGKNGQGSTYQYVEEESGCEGHLHLKCSNCNKIIHLDCHFMDEIENHIAKDHGFKLSCKNSVIYGLCMQCQNQLK